MVKKAKAAKTAKNSRTKTTTKKLPSNGRKRFPRLRSITKSAGD